MQMRSVWDVVFCVAFVLKCSTLHSWFELNPCNLYIWNIHFKYCVQILRSNIPFAIKHVSVQIVSCLNTPFKFPTQTPRYRSLQTHSQYTIYHCTIVENGFKRSWWYIKDGSKPCEWSVNAWCSLLLFWKEARWM